MEILFVVNLQKFCKCPKDRDLVCYHSVKPFDSQSTLMTFLISVIIAEIISLANNLQSPRLEFLSLETLMFCPNNPV